MGPLLKINYLLAAAVLVSLGLFFFVHDQIRALLVRLQGMFLPGVWGTFISLWDDLTAIKKKIVERTH